MEGLVNVLEKRMSLAQSFHLKNFNSGLKMWVWCQRVSELWSDIQTDKLRLLLYKETSLGTERCTGYQNLLTPFTRTWTILPYLKNEQNFPYLSGPTQLRILKPMGSLEFPNQKLRQIGLGVSELCLDKHADRQTEITTLFFI